MISIKKKEKKIMAMKKYGDIVATTGAYTNNEGVEKKRTTKVGIVLVDGQIPDETRITLKLEALPIARTGKDGYPECWLSVYKDQPRDTYKPAPRQAEAAPEEWQATEHYQEQNLDNKNLPF